MYCRLYSVQEDTEADNGLFPIIKKNKLQTTESEEQM